MISTPRVLEEEMLTVQAPSILTLTSLVPVPQISLLLPPKTMPFSQVAAEELFEGERILDVTKARRNENSPSDVLRTIRLAKLLLLSFNK